jgi:hydroxypyruvate reductase/glycerate 2-kinase
MQLIDGFLCYDIVQVMENTEFIIREMFSAALTAVDPSAAVLAHGDALRSLYLEGGFERLIAAGFGKASFSMAQALEEMLDDLLDEGIIITKYGHAPGELRKFRIIEAGHPVPDENSEMGTNAIINIIQDATVKTLIVTLVSGGGSALLVSPLDGILLQEKQDMTSLLLGAGADISEFNAVRKHLSRIKGGRFAELAFPATVVSLILSDVIGDRFDVIASGPTAPDPTTYTDALAVLQKYGLMETAPPSVIRLLKAGEKKLLSETPKPGSPVFQCVRNSIIGNNRSALEAARLKALNFGLKGEIMADDITGEARKTGKWLARRALAAMLEKGEEPFCMVSGGETTVTVTGKGKGGRNMELALAFALEIEGTPGITLLSAGSDGTDGPTDAAGAMVDGMTAIRARNMGLDPEAYLRDNDSYTFFRKAGGLFVTGPTGTNVMDMQFIFIA